MRAHPQRIHPWVVLAATVLVGAGCDGRIELGEAAAAAPPAPVAGGELEFALADMLKPRMDGAAPIDPYLGPLIYLEVNGPDAPAPSRAPIGSVLPDADGTLVVDAARPTVYFSDETVAADGHGHRQVSYVWFRADTAAQAAPQGVRLTFDSRGFPHILEVLSDSRGKSVFYVTESLEDAAAEEFGGPLAGRRHALERADPGEPEVEIARLLDSGAMPMGPFVYQASGSTDIGTMHCRCSPSQVEDIRRLIEYELEPLATLEGLWPTAEETGFAPPQAPFERLRVSASF